MNAYIHLKNSFHGPTVCQILRTKDEKQSLNLDLFYSTSSTSISWAPTIQQALLSVLVMSIDSDHSQKRWKEKKGVAEDKMIR